MWHSGKRGCVVNPSELGSPENANELGRGNINVRVPFGCWYMRPGKKWTVLKQ